MVGKAHQDFTRCQVSVKVLGFNDQTEVQWVATGKCPPSPTSNFESYRYQTVKHLWRWLNRWPFAHFMSREQTVGGALSAEGTNDLHLRKGAARLSAFLSLAPPPSTRTQPTRLHKTTLLTAQKKQTPGIVTQHELIISALIIQRNGLNNCFINQGSHPGALACVLQFNYGEMPPPLK